MEADSKILARIKALLALAGNNPNEHEAAAASQKAMELMEQYNIEASTLDTSVKSHGERKQNFTAGGLYGWQRKLWGGVAKLNFCMYWCEKGLKKGDKYQHKVLGSPTNVLSMGLMAEYLQNAVERLAQQYAKANGYNVFCRDMIAYREGMAARLVERLEQMRKERLEEERRREQEMWAKRNGPAGTSTGLVLANLIHSEEDYNNDFYYGYEPGTHARRRAEREAKSAAWKAEYDEKQRIHKERMANDPEYKAAYDKANADANARLAAEYEKERKQRERNAGKPGYDEYGYKQQKPRYRNATPEEERARLATFRTGYAKGDTIGFDNQIDKQNRKAVR